MVRFIINNIEQLLYSKVRFTFQYGQIYYSSIFHVNNHTNEIYIPIWLDLLSELSVVMNTVTVYLHSNMVRFIIIKLIITCIHIYIFTFQYGQIYYKTKTEKIIKIKLIYIPIWLDLLYQNFRFLLHHPLHLHSNMVRFIIYFPEHFRRRQFYLHSNMVRFIIFLQKILLSKCS